MVLVFFFHLGSPEDVIKRIEQRSHAVDSKGVAEYLRALVLTNAIADYLPDERYGRSATLPALVSFLCKNILYVTYIDLCYPSQTVQLENYPFMNL